MTATASRENWRKEGWRASSVRWLKFNAVGGIGIAVQLVVLAVLKVAFHFDYLWATALAVETSVIHNFCGTSASPGSTGYRWTGQGQAMLSRVS